MSDEVILRRVLYTILSVWFLHLCNTIINWNVLCLMLDSSWSAWEMRSQPGVLACWCNVAFTPNSAATVSHLYSCITWLLTYILMQICMTKIYLYPIIFTARRHSTGWYSFYPVVILNLPVRQTTG